MAVVGVFVEELVKVSKGNITLNYLSHNAEHYEGPSMLGCRRGDCVEMGGVLSADSVNKKTLTDRRLWV